MVTPVDPPSQSDEQLAIVVDQWLDMLPAERPDLTALTAAHPHLADELREVWGAMMVADAVAEHSSAGLEHTPTFRGEMLLQPPTQLGDFDLGEQLGRGGMGVVYRARQRSLDREVAVKVILGGAQATEDEQSRFQSEAEAAARLDHPNIVPIYDIGKDGGWWYFGMKLVEGKTLGDMLADGPLPTRQAAEVVLTVARAIAYAHRRGVIHRDLKPANILVDTFGEPHVSDFGLAKRVAAGGSITQTGAVLGTPSYMAPEQAAQQRGEVGPASDVFSLGAILYALITGRPPFQGSTPVDTLLLLLEEEPLPPRLVNRRVDRQLEMIVLRCLQKPAELRYASAGALADDLEAYLAGEPIAARSGLLSDVVARVFGDTHHAAVLENWGVLWMWHAVVLLLMCLVTNWFQVKQHAWPAMASPWPYLVLWGGGLAVWAPIFWALRHRAGPVTAVERQIAHAWGASIVAVMLLFVIESLLRMPVLSLSPVLGVICGMVFVVKAGILTGTFYFHAAALFATALVMAVMQSRGVPYGVSVFGIVAAGTFFLPGWKYFRQNRRHREDSP